MQTYPRSIFKPSVSIIVPAYNSERLIPACLTSLFKSAVQYMGFCEIIVVDDGSNDHTYEIAWATIKECRKKWPHISGKVVRHTARLGRDQAIKTGVYKAFGALIAIVDPQALWKQHTLKELVETSGKHSKKSSTSTTTLYKAEKLRKMLP
ncbi:MAG: glycosyltransferase [Candidatus Bathyarchaeota archaeon]|nr:glycosyltransferase [Candidatus Bathyarchaeota archaeon]